MKNIKIINANKKIPSNTIQDNETNTLIVSPYIRVSTSEEEQLNSYQSQIIYYTNLIKNNSKWKLGDIYSDEGISGTQTKKREDFKRMIHDALEGKIDMIITKSISRFARNTLDTLKYVRLLKEQNIGVIFEKENINTLSMNGEILLTILSSLAQQESESIASNVKMGIKMKMKRGEMVGMPKCLGYDYDKETRKLSINKKEAELVKHIFNSYIGGSGATVIAKELTQKKDCYSPRGNKKWDLTTILGIIKNEKYIGDLLLGKNITVDPITHRKIKNLGEEEQYYVENHHEAIIDKETFKRANEILEIRSNETKKNIGKRTKYSRKHAFSSITKCGYCGSRTTRRNWGNKTSHQKFVWRCSNYLLNGKSACTESKGVDEKILEQSFIQSFNKLKENNIRELEEYLKSFSKFKNDNNYEGDLKNVQIKIKKIKEKMNSLVNMKLENIINEEIYKKKYNSLSEELKKLLNAEKELQNANIGQVTITQKIQELTSTLSRQHEPLEAFDRDIFDKIVEAVILGYEDENGVYNPYNIVIQLKSGITMMNEVLFDETISTKKKSYSNCRINTQEKILENIFASKYTEKKD